MAKRKCKQCNEVFEKKQPLQYVCSITCSIAYSKSKEKQKKDKEWRKEKQERKKAIMTHSEWLKVLQVVFNKFIRERDKNKPCISCGRPLIAKFDAGHFYSVGAYPNLRFDEDNVFGQCVHCNQHLHGNIAEYSIRLPERIGKERFEALKSRRKEVSKLSIPEIEEMIQVYKDKIRSIS